MVNYFMKNNNFKKKRGFVMCDFISHNKQLFDELDIFIDSLTTKEGALIQVLHEAQGIFGYLPKEVQLHVARKLGVAPAKVYGLLHSILILLQNL